MVGSKQAFEVSLADVAQTQLQGKTDVYLEFHVDDTTGANEVQPYLFKNILSSTSEGHLFHLFSTSLVACFIAGTFHVYGRPTGRPCFTYRLSLTYKLLENNFLLLLLQCEVSRPFIYTPFHK